MGTAAARLPALAALVAAAALVLPGAALARGGRYTIDGATAAEQAQVRAALDASSFDWSLVPATIAIHVVRGTDSRAVPGQIWLDANLLDSGTFSWGVVQHEYAHQVDFFLLGDAARQTLLAARGGTAWFAGQTAYSPDGTLRHAQLASERFASTLAWAYWPSPQNSMRPQSRGDESAAMAPAAFRSLLARLLGVDPG